MKSLCLVAILVLTAAWAGRADAASPIDEAFVAKVSQGGAFEVLASTLATRRAVAQDVKDFAAAEVHDHTLVGRKLKMISAEDGIRIDPQTNPEFSAKLQALKQVSANGFDVAYMTQMADIHAKDGAAFAQEAVEGSAPAFKAFAAETHTIVQRHIGAIHGAPPR